MAKVAPTGRVSRETTEAAPTMGLGPAAAASAATEDAAGVDAGGTNVDRDGRPYCAKHNAAMIAAGSREGHTYYTCRVAGCSESAKRLRGNVPRQPTYCTQRICAESLSALEVVAERSSIGQLVMRCPRCGLEVTVPRPGFGEQHVPLARLGPDDFGAR